MLTRDQILKAFTRLGEILWQQRKTGEIAVFGGTAIVLEHDFRAATGDVDAMIRKEHGAIVQAQQQVAKELGLPLYWLNEQATSYLSSIAKFHLFGTYPDEMHPGLRVHVAAAEYLLVMKAMSLRADDARDAVALARETGLTTVQQITDLIRKFYPNETITDRMHVNILEIVRQIDASSE